MPVQVPGLPGGEGGMVRVDLIFDIVTFAAMLFLVREMFALARRWRGGGGIRHAG